MSAHKQQHFGFSQTVIALAVLATFSPARAEDDTDAAKLTPPKGFVSVGVGLATGDDKDRARFGMFNGLRNNDVNPLLGFGYFNHDSESGRWITFEGRNLGLDSREVGLSVRQLGDWKFTADYSEITRHDPRTINTGLIGAGTTTPTVQLLPAPGTGYDLDLKLRRKSWNFGGEKWFGGALQAEVNFKTEDKDGARLFGRGFTCPSAAAPSPTCGAVLPGGIANQWALLMLPEPINSNIKQVDGKLNWSGSKFFLSAAYYGSFYTNSNGSLTPTVPGTLVNGLGNPVALDPGLRGILQLPMALPPDNQAHQLSLAGNYTFSPKMRVNFKYSYTHATQNDNFLGMGLTGAPAGRSDLGGIVDTQRAQAGFSAHPMDKLHVHGDVKYVDQNDRTPIALYNLEGTNTFTNEHFSPKKLDAKLEGTYRLPANYNATAGVNYEHEDFGTLTPTTSIAGVTGIRQKLQEWGYRFEVSKLMSETLTGRLSYNASWRSGDSPWLQPNTLPATGVTAVTDAQIYNRTAIFPFIYENRERHKVRLMTNWEPTDRLSLQLFADYGKDRFSAPTDHGLRDTDMAMLSLDATYMLSAAWKMTAYASYGAQTVHAGHSTGYDAALRDRNTNAGLGIIGKPSERFRVGADLLYLYDTLKYDQTQDPAASLANTLFLAEQGGLPDVTYRLLRLKLYGEYAVQKSASIRLDFIHDRSFFNEWTYNFNGVPFIFSDNTILTSKQHQNVSFLGVSYIYRFR
ncbi:MAG: MtrB/PioB family decaheme-associated outer membrane protein [Burkholderiales bacterium]